MYYPYIRGRQYELLALKELIMSERLSEHITPIIEPVKLSSTLSKTMEEFVEKDRNICVICNPMVGSFSTEMKNEEKDKNKQSFLTVLSKEQVLKTHIVKENSLANLNLWENEMGVKKTDWYVINTSRDALSIYLNLFKDNTPKMSFVPDESAFRRKISGERSLLEDRFKKCDRNSDYAKKTDEFFSDDHLFYKEEGFLGFSDYSIIGSGYLESGFAPYAVAIHIVYLDDKKIIRVHHFVSDSNYDIKNPAAKFYEALKKLVEWITEKNIDVTASLQLFIDHYNNGTYPGLGTVKKIAFMHHLEVVGKYLDEVK